MDKIKKEIDVIIEHTGSMKYLILYVFLAALLNPLYKDLNFSIGSNLNSISSNNSGDEPSSNSCKSYDAKSYLKNEQRKVGNEIEAINELSFNGSVYSFAMVAWSENTRFDCIAKVLCKSNGSYDLIDLKVLRKY